MNYLRSGTLLALGLVIVLATLVTPAQEQELKVEPIQGPSASTGSAARPSTAAAEVEDAAPPALVLENDSDSVPEKNAAEKDGHAFSRYDALLTGLTVFALAVFVGFEVISKVPTTLHTPLMSGSNAISGITAVGAIIVGGHTLASFASFLGFLAIALAMINVVGGFLVTHRMLSMFKRK